MAHLIHPNVLRVLNYDPTEDRQPYIVMELLRGESLSTKLQREAARVRGGRPHRATSCARARGRALRPGDAPRPQTSERLLTITEDERHDVQLLDLGISVRATNDRRLTGEHDVLGTTDYISSSARSSLAQARRSASVTSISPQVTANARCP